MPKFLRWLPVVILLILLPSAVYAQPPSPTIHVLHIEGTINPVMANYIERGINQAEEAEAVACVIQMNTPGGLLDSTEEIVLSIMNAEVPVIVYVTPKGAWAASAGVFITLSSHIAVMTPGTTIGAAHPVSGGDTELSDDEIEKITNFSAKWIQTIAEERDRNAKEAQLAVTESKSFTDTEALEYNLIDLRVDSLENLISQINGWQVVLSNGNTVTIDTQEAVIEDFDMSGIEKFLFAITNPNIAYILLSLAIMGITVEIFSPGLIFPGVAGAVSGLLAFYALGMLPVNYAGVLLIVLALGLFITEAFTPTFGLLTAGGITALVTGSLILFKGGPLFQVNIFLILGIAIIAAVTLVFVISRVFAAHKLQATTGMEELPGKNATVRIPLNPEGKVFFKGELWTAVIDSGSAETGETVKIKRYDGLKLFVTKINKGGDS